MFLEQRVGSVDINNFKRNELKPVANLRYQDPGDMVIAAENFKDLIPHHFVLTEVYRQKEEQLICAIHELSRGTPSEETFKFLTSLQHPWPENTQPVKLFSLNYDVDKCNSDNLLSLHVTFKIVEDFFLEMIFEDGQDLHGD